MGLIPYQKLKIKIKIILYFGLCSWLSNGSSLVAVYKVYCDFQFISYKMLMKLIFQNYKQKQYEQH